MTRHTLVRGGCVLSLARGVGNFARADVLVADDVIAEVAPTVRRRDAEVIDATDCIVMPGFVDTHRHLWTSLLRNLGNPPAPVPSDTAGYRPDDVYAATLIGLMGAAEAGITTVVDWCDLPGGPDHTAAVRQAHADSGLRTVLVLALPPGADADAAPAVASRTVAEALRAREGAGGRTEVAVGLDAADARAVEQVAETWAAARQAGLRVHAHVGTDPSRPGALAALARRGLLGEDVTLVHGSHLEDTELDAVAATGTAVALTPSRELADGLGAPPLQRLIDRGIRPGLGVDHEWLAPGDLFAQMRATISLQHAAYFDLKLAGKAGLPNLLTTREVIRYGTVDGARVAGLADRTGSLAPGQQADLVVLRTDRPNIWPVNDPIGAVVWGMDTSNLDCVLVGGQVLMRGGLLDADLGRARHLATQAQRHLAATAGQVTAGTPGGDG